MAGCVYMCRTTFLSTVLLFGWTWLAESSECHSPLRIYLDWINKSLAEFTHGWNHHGMRTEGGHSPEQLFVSGILRLRYSGMAAVDFFDTVDEAYGVEGIAAEDDDDVILPRLSFHLTDEHLQQLRDTVDPTLLLANYGIELYQQTLIFINAKINESPQLYG